jgi:CMP-N,N'-diacetyllegionaminic acid synthase
MGVTMQTLALIPARGGSKGIIRKNMVEIKNLPLVVHSVLHALNSNAVDRVIVSTDDEEIQRVALSYGAEVPFLRPRELAADHVLDLPVFEHALEYLDAHEGYRPDFVLHLRPTAPYRQSTWIEEAISLLAANIHADSVRSVSEPDKHPYRMFRIDEHGFLDPIMKHLHPLPYLLRRQDLPKIYYYNCVIDVTRWQTIMAKKSMTGDKIVPYIMDPNFVFDVDTPRDLEITRYFMERMA